MNPQGITDERLAYLPLGQPLAHFHSPPLHDRLSSFITTRFCSVRFDWFGSGSVRFGPVILVSFRFADCGICHPLTGVPWAASRRTGCVGFTKFGGSYLALGENCRTSWPAGKIHTVHTHVLERDFQIQNNELLSQVRFCEMRFRFLVLEQSCLLIALLGYLPSSRYV